MAEKMSLDFETHVTTGTYTSRHYIIWKVTQGITGECFTSKKPARDVFYKDGKRIIKRFSSDRV